MLDKARITFTFNNSLNYISVYICCYSVFPLVTQKDFHTYLVESVELHEKWVQPENATTRKLAIICLLNCATRLREDDAYSDKTSQ